MTREEFLAFKEAAAKWDVAVAIHRTNPLPIDNDSVFGSLEDAQTYVATVPTAYPGQIIAVVTESATTMYYLDYETPEPGQPKSTLKLVAFGESESGLVQRVAALEEHTFKDNEIVEIFGGNASGWTEV